MVALSAVGAELESRLEQLKKELDALRADARAREVTWKEADGRLVRATYLPGCILFSVCLDEWIKH